MTFDVLQQADDVLWQEAQRRTTADGWQVWEPQACRPLRWLEAAYDVALLLIGLALSAGIGIGIGVTFAHWTMGR